MAVTVLAPGTIWLGGPRTEENTLAASESITPGHLVERFNSTGVWRLRKHATAAAATAQMVATEKSMSNGSIADTYAANDLVEASIGAGGSSFLMFIASGQNIVFGQTLESAGDGTLRALASGVALFSALETKVSVTVLTRIRVEVV